MSYRGRNVEGLTVSTCSDSGRRTGSNVLPYICKMNIVIQSDQDLDIELL